MIALLRLPMRPQKRPDLAHGEGDALLRLFPWKHADFGFRREHRAFHGDGVGMRWNIVRQK